MKITMKTLSGNLFAEDPASYGVDGPASVAKYRDLLEQELLAAYPEAAVYLSVEDASGAPPAPRVELDVELDDVDAQEVADNCLAIAESMFVGAQWVVALPATTAS
ncbi:MAG: hypothetical protein C4523_08760 [Myxococcales bacterium]|nr:MAG: hypothetical protein C4523_08760 [Myxococcales bacterium]